MEKIIEGKVYRKEEEGAFNYPTDGYPNDQYSSHIICDCGSKNFNLQYGHYELLATCCACNKAEVVYSG